MSKKSNDKKVMLGQKGKEGTVNKWEHPELVPVVNKARTDKEKKKMEFMEREKHKKLVVDDQEESERSLSDEYIVRPEALEIEYPKKGYNVVTRVVKTKNQVYSSSPNNKRGIKLTGIAEEGDSVPEFPVRGDVPAKQKPRAQRRESFLYRLPSEELLSKIRLPDTRKGLDLEEEEDQIVTPFAQILATLKDVRSNLAKMLSTQEPRETREGRERSPSILNSNRPYLDNFRLSDAGATKVMGILAVDTLESMDWCLEKLEHLQTNRAVGDMAADKFKMLLNRELSVMSQSSNEGRNISKHFTDTYCEPQHIHDFEEDEYGHEDHEDHEDAHHNIVVWEEEPAREAPSVHAGSMSKVQAENGLITSKRGGLEGFATQLKKLPDLSTWGLDVFSLDKSIQDQRVLTFTTFKIFQDRDILRTLKIDQKMLISFLMTLEDHYLKSVPYHNHLHAADVTQSTHILLQSSALGEVFTPLEAMAAILACAVHDVDHPGVTNQYLINTSSELAVMYNDESVLENHHLAVAFKLLQIPDCDILSNLSQKQRLSVRKMMIDMVLATDMSKHMSLLANLKTLVETKKVAGSGVLLLDNYNDRIQVLQNMIHCSDLSNPTKPLTLYVEWVDRLMKEFWKQGDKEREQGLEISPMCDRENATVEKSQVGFINFIVYPLWETYAELVFPDAQPILTLIQSNRTYYEGLLGKGT